LWQFAGLRQVGHVITTGLKSVPSDRSVKPFHALRPVFIRLLVGVFVLKRFNPMTDLRG
jgi:hypothetical protein